MNYQEQRNRLANRRDELISKKKLTGDERRELNQIVGNITQLDLLNNPHPLAKTNRDLSARIFS